MVEYIKEEEVKANLVRQDKMRDYHAERLKEKMRAHEEKIESFKMDQETF